MERSKAGVRVQSVLVILFVVSVLILNNRSTGFTDKSSNALVGSATPEGILQPTSNPSSSTSETTVPGTIAAQPTLDPPSTAVATVPDIPKTKTPASTTRPSAPPTGLSDQSFILARGQSTRIEVAFTFDAGEGPGYTSEILDLLARYDVRGSFGVTGKWAEQNPEFLSRIVQEGHMVINHTYDHSSWTGDSTGGIPLSTQQRLVQVQRTEEIILAQTGYQTAPFFRFPYGAYDVESLEILFQLGYAYTIWWTCDTLAWDDYSAPQISERCSSSSQYGGSGAIILMHVTQTADLEALPLLIEAYLEAGYAPVTIEEMIRP